MSGTASTDRQRVQRPVWVAALATAVGITAVACSGSEPSGTRPTTTEATGEAEDAAAVVRSDVVEIGPQVVPIEWTTDSAGLRDLVVVTDDAVWFRTAVGLESHDIATGEVATIPIDTGDPFGGWAVGSPEADTIWVGAEAGGNPTLAEVDLASGEVATFPVPAGGRGRFVDHRHLLVEGAEQWAVIDTSDGTVVVSGATRTIDGGGGAYVIEHAAVANDAAWIDWSNGLERVDIATGASEEMPDTADDGVGIVDGGAFAANGSRVALLRTTEDESSGAFATEVDVYEGAELSSTVDVPADGFCRVVPDDGDGFTVICQQGLPGATTFDSWRLGADGALELIDRLAAPEELSMMVALQPAAGGAFAWELRLEDASGERGAGSLLISPVTPASVQRLTMPEGAWVDSAFLLPQGDGWHMIGPDQAVVWRFEH